MKYGVYAILSMTFAIVNILTLHNLEPWIDEVMMLDTAYNAAVHGSWETTAWYRVAGEYPFSTYPPLYQMLAAVWIKLFGGGLVVVRSLNLLITFMLGLVGLRLMERHGLRLTVWTVGLFTLLLWGTSEMAWMYRNGRPDMLCALMAALAVLATERYLQTKNLVARITIVATSALALCSGFQTAVYLCALWMFFFVEKKEQRNEAVRLLVLLLAGMLMGVTLVSLFMQAHGRLLAFACSIIQYSTTLSGIALAVLPLVGEVFGFSALPYTQKLQELATETDICQRLTPVTEYHSFIILAVIALAAYALMRIRSVRAGGFSVLMFALCVPIIMTLAGRFVVYYRWVVFLPLLAAVMSIAVMHRWWRVVFSVVAVMMTVFGIKSMLPNGHGCYDNLRSFVLRQHFQPQDAVVCPFSVFYEMKPLCDTCYFVGIFPAEYVDHVDYIIEARDGDTFDHPITDYVHRLKADTTVALTAIDHCEHPSLTLYQVHYKYE